MPTIRYVTVFVAEIKTVACMSKKHEDEECVCCGERVGVFVSEPEVMTYHMCRGRGV